MEHGLKQVALLSCLIPISLVCLDSSPASADRGKQARALKTVQAIERSLQQGGYSGADLDRIQRRLDAVLDLLEGQRPSRAGANEECVKFAQDIYKRVTNRTKAMEKAHAQCKGRVDMAMVKMVFEVHRRVHSRQQAFEVTMSQMRKHRVFGKQALVTYAFEVLRRSRSKQNAMKESLQLAGSVPRNSLGCIERAFATYKRSQSRDNALRSSFKLCGK